MTNMLVAGLGERQKSLKQPPRPLNISIQSNITSKQKFEKNEKMMISHGNMHRECHRIIGKKSI